MTSTYTLVGGDGSPYSCKMRAAMRYRRIPFRWVPQYALGSAMFAERFPLLKARVIPILVRPDGTYANDSTPLILELERAFPNERCLVPKAPGQAFLAALLEDFADEWCTKIMFEGRFATEEDAVFGAAWQFWQGANPSAPSAANVDALVNGFAKRQVARRARVVGSGGWPLMERCLEELCETLTAMWREDRQPFLFGARPTNADFALFGQLRQCAADPLPSRTMHKYPCAWSWVWMMDELGGLEPPADDGRLPATPTRAVLALLRIAAKAYLPFMAANALAYSRGERRVSVPVYDGAVRHAQPTFRYQATHCWPKLREQFGRLDGEDLEYVRAALGATGCLGFFDGSSAGPNASL